MSTNQIVIIATVLGALGGVAGFLGYLENRKTRALKEEVMNLDKQIKQLELAKSKGQLS